MNKFLVALYSYFSILLLCSFFVSGCTSNSGISNDSGVADAGDDMGADAGDDMGTDAGDDTGDDAGADSGDDCVPESDCAKLEAECGVIDDGCGALLDCGGSCAEGTACGGDGEPNRCGCTPVTCESMGANCGAIDDGCGASLECGTCSNDDECGLVKPNVCAHEICYYGWCYVHPYPLADTLFFSFTDESAKTWSSGTSGTTLGHDGQSWSMVDAYTRTPSDMLGMWYSPGENDGWMIGSNGAMLRWDDGLFHCQRPDSVFWAEIDENTDIKYDLHGIWATDRANVWIVGDEGILHFDGAVWKEVRSNSRTPMYGIVGDGENTVYAAGTNQAGQVNVLTWNGSNWTKMDLGDLSNTSGVAYDITMDENGHLWLVGAALDVAKNPIGSLVMIFDGDTWSIIDSDFSGTWNTIAIDKTGRVWMGGDSGTVGYFDEGSGRVVFTTGLFGDKAIKGIDVSESILRVVGEFGLNGVYRAGMWRLEQTPLPETVSAVIPTVREFADDQVWVGGDRFVMHWSGIDWGVAPLSGQIIDFHYISSNQIWALGNRNSDGVSEAVAFAYDGNSWTEVAKTAGTAKRITGTSSTDVRVELETGEFLHFNGTNWQVRPADAFPGNTQTGIPSRTSDWSITSDGFARPDHAATLIWPFDGLQAMPKSAWGTSETDIWAGGGDGLIHFDGAEWKVVSRQVQVLDIHGSGPDDVWFVGNKTEDGGPVWRWDGEKLESMDFEADDETVRSVSVTANGDAYLAGDVLYYFDGANWQTLYSGDSPIATIARNEQELMFGSDLSVFRRDGEDWDSHPVNSLLDRPPITEDTRIRLHDSWVTPGGDIMFVGQSTDEVSAVLLIWDGNAWGNGIQMTMNGTMSYQDVWATSPDDAYVLVDELGYIFHYKHYIRTFDTVDPTTEEPLGAIWGTQDSKLWTFGPYGTILKY